MVAMAIHFTFTPSRSFYAEITCLQFEYVN